MLNDCVPDPASLASQLTPRHERTAHHGVASPWEGRKLNEAFLRIRCSRARDYVIALASALADDTTAP